MRKEDIAATYPWVTCEIECDDGWLPLISALCDRLHWYCDEHRIKHPVVKQIKEKFGALNFYIENEHFHTKAGQGMFDLIGHYEAMSRYVCERCGTTIGVGWSNKWIKSVCKPCFNRHIKPRWPEREWKSDWSESQEHKIIELTSKELNKYVEIIRPKPLNNENTV